MRNFIILCILYLLALQTAESYAQEYRDLYSDTWVASDALGRTMPAPSEVGQVKTDQRRVVGMFYITWHGTRKTETIGTPPYTTRDVTKILEEAPDARFDIDHPAWGASAQDFVHLHWGEPEEGYFLSKDEYIIRRDMSMLSDAGVDVIVLDVTNAERYWSEWESLFSVMQQMKAEGNKVPQFCFWAFNVNVFSVVQDLYEKIYKQNKYHDLWFSWDEKPLLLCRLFFGETPDKNTPNYAPSENPNYDPDAVSNTRNPHYGNPDYTQKEYTGYTAEVCDFFTMRSMWDGALCGNRERCTGTEDYWTFVLHLEHEPTANLKPAERVSLHNGIREEIPVSPAQHPHNMVGKSWSPDKKEPALDEHDMPIEAFVPWLGETVKNPSGYGIYFQQSWNDALEANPQFVFLCDWNEWTHPRWFTAAGFGQHFKQFMGRESNFFFYDQYNAEYNRTIQPMKDGYTDNYYMQMAQNIRRYKGARPIPVNRGFSSISIDGGFEDWAMVETEYRDTRGDIFHRDFDGYNKLHYTNTSGRNDILTAKTAVDARNVYFYAETDSALTSHTGKNWMLLLIDADNNPKTGWNGYDFIVNKKVDNDQSTSVMKYTGNVKTPWKQVSRVSYRYKGNKVEIAVPRNLLGLNEDSFTFDFKWADNPNDLDDIITLCTSGDTAPNRRFNYRFILAQTPPMGWNCTYSLVTEYTEDLIKQGAEFVEKKMKQFGYEYIVMDMGWNFAEGLNIVNYHVLQDPPQHVDEYGRLIPNPSRFPSSAGGKGFKPMADYMHKRGLKLGIHVMRGVPWQAVAQKLPIKGTTYTADEIASEQELCGWFHGLKTIDTSKPGAQEYYDSIFKMYADWGIDFVKMDDIGHPYSNADIAAVHRAIVKTGKPIILDITPGPVFVEKIEHLRQNVNMWRINSDFHDHWKFVEEAFNRCREWQGLALPGNWPDCDLLPFGGKLRKMGFDDYLLGVFNLKREEITDEYSRFTDNEKQTVFTLWAICRSPLFPSGFLPEMTDSEYRLFSNRDVIEMDQHCVNSREIRANEHEIIWAAEHPDMGIKYVAMFNLNGDGQNSISIRFSELGLSGKFTVRDIWNNHTLGTFEGSVISDVPPHGCILLEMKNI
jgi:hypothetical protein